MSERCTNYPAGDEQAGEEIEGCSSCDSADPAGYHQHDRAGTDGPCYLCEVCFSTFAGEGFLHPSLYDHDVRKILTSVAQCTNMVLRRLEAIEERLKT